MSFVQMSPLAESQFFQVESECHCEREKRAQAVAKETKEVRSDRGKLGARVCTSQNWMQMEARLTKAEKEEIERMKVLIILPSAHVL